MQVGPEIEQILFELEAADGEFAKVNRKNLGKQGSTTQFVITVTSSDKRNKSQYTVNVTRGEKIREESGKIVPPIGAKISGTTKQNLRRGYLMMKRHIQTPYFMVIEICI